jgi:hypothetical protein
MHVIGRLAGKKATQVVGWMDRWIDGWMDKHPSIYQAPLQGVGGTTFHLLQNLNVDESRVTTRWLG